jgi:hypothetical protein
MSGDEATDDGDGVSIAWAEQAIKNNVGIATMRVALGPRYNQEAPTLANYLAGIARRPDLLQRVMGALMGVSNIHWRTDGESRIGCACGLAADHVSVQA